MGLQVGEFEELAAGVYLEGLAIDHARDIVWYSDVIGGGIHGLAADGTMRSFNRDRMWTGGLLVNGDGAVLSSGQGGILWTDPASGESGWLLDEIDGEVINGVNEMVPDGTGGIYFGTIDLERVLEGGETRPTAIYRLTVERDVIPVADDIHFTNGMMLSADRKRLYCNDTFTGTCVYDVRPDLTLSHKRMLLEKRDADGMALDMEGNLWVTGCMSSDLIRLGPRGESLEPVKTPGGAVTQIRFGGADGRDYFINAVGADTANNLKEGSLPEGRESVLYRGRSAVPGLTLPPARFKLR